MNRLQSCSKASGERERNLRRAGDFHMVLLGMAAHDLRQPLQIIQSTCEWFNSKLNADMRKAHQGALAVARLTEQLDCLAGALHLYEGTMTMDLSPVPLGPLLDGILTEDIELARQRGLDLRLRPTTAMVLSNAMLLKSIVRNLLSNAIKYTPAPGRVLLGCRRRGADISIDIYDTGIGIAANQLQRIFDAFQRVDSTKPDGLGLGLFVVRRAVELLGHHIEVNSRVGRGSRFSVLARAAIYDRPIANRRA